VFSVLSPQNSIKSKKSIGGTSPETVIKAIKKQKIFMKAIQLIILCTICFIISNCGKVGPLSLPEDKLDKTIITYPCDEECKEKFEKEKQRQQSVIIQTD